MIKNILSSYIHNHWLKAPAEEESEGKAAAFESLYEAARTDGADNLIKYDCPYPKYEFLNYLVRHKNVLLHGSYTSNIDLLQPIRKSTDNRSCGKIRGVYACSDGIWPIFYAIFNREGTSGLVSNGCYLIRENDGIARKFYYFSIESELLHGRPWITGMVYVVPKYGFEQLRDPAGFLLEEWASQVVVAPLARMVVAPEDFPFLDKVQGYNRGNWQALQEKMNTYDTSEAYDALLGQYEVPGDCLLTVVRDNKTLFLQVAGYPSVDIHPETDTRFALGTARIDFVTDGRDGDAQELVIHVRGHEIRATRTYMASTA